MKPIEKDEIFQHLHGFLKNRGVEFTEGSYAKTIQKSCGLLTDVINLSQQGIERAKEGVDKKLDQLRQTIHEKTAPRSTAPPNATSDFQAKASPPPPRSEASTAADSVTASISAASKKARSRKVASAARKSKAARKRK